MLQQGGGKDNTDKLHGVRGCLPKDQELFPGGPSFGALPYGKGLCSVSPSRSILGTSEALDRGPRS